ncbi:MAG: SPFH domain-containing protein [Aestuariibaculum sp.]
MINFIKNQLSKVIEWNDQNPNTLWQQWNGGSDEIISASKLIVKPGQGAAVVYEGKLVDIITDEGIFNLKTDNHPFITTLLKIRQSFESEHKLYIYFFRTAQVINENWGTSQPIKYQEPTYKFPIELGCNGSISYKISNPQHFYSEVLGSLDVYTTYDAKQLFLGRIPTFIATLLSKNQYSYLQIDQEQLGISQDLQPIIAEEMATIGLEVTDFKILGTHFLPETQKHIQKIADIQSDKFAAEDVGLTYEELQKLEALRDAARNEGGLAGAGVGLGAGMELGKGFTSAFNGKETNAATPREDVFLLIEQLKSLFDKGILTEAEFTTKKQELLKKI